MAHWILDTMYRPSFFPQVAHEVLALQILTLLLETPTDDSVEIAISFLKESGQKLCEVTIFALDV